MELKMQVKDLRISFRTVNGKVQAVRGINFDLAKGETLAIVGESGSGKSVTSKAILGIQAANAITESGEIIYDGKDLLKITEEDFHKIRGDKIAMIFQDPMSSLNPIVKIGRQLTEAMILKGKARQRESRNNFNTYLKHLNGAMKACTGLDAAKVDEMTKSFDKFELKAIELEKAYRNAFEAARQTLTDMKSVVFEMEKNALGNDGGARILDIAGSTFLTPNDYVVSGQKGARIKDLSNKIKNDWNAIKGKKDDRDYTALLADMAEVREILEEAVAKPVPNFFRMGYYLTFSGKELPEMPVEELNRFLRKYLDDNFMTEFAVNLEKALKYTADISYQNIDKAIALLEEKKSVFAEKDLNRKACLAAAKELSAAIKATIDPLSLRKDSLTYTFERSIKDEIKKYFDAIPANRQAVKKHDKDQKKHDRLVARGKNPDWEVAAAAVIDLELVKNDMLHIIDRLIRNYEDIKSERSTRNFDEEAVASIDYLKESASGIVEKVTRKVAKERAIRLMDEVGIAEPHKRYNQYPFEFSGGMRQRIVIAIALAANPDILICDEPTTALDVTIQSQILELINKLKRERQLSVIFITHDLGVVANMADRVAVMYAGKIVETGTAEEIFYSSAHPYTWALLSSMPDLDTNDKLEAIPGTPPNMIYPPVGDAFAPRNKYAMKIDFERQPPMFKITDTHYAATWLLHPDAPHVDPPKTVLDRIARMKAKREMANAE